MSDTTINMTRGQKLWGLVREARNVERVYLDRARLITEAYRATEGTPILMRRAIALEHLFKHLPIYIDEGQLLAGDYSVAPMGFEWYPEIAVEWVKEYLENNESIYDFGEKDVTAEMMEICDYWMEKSARETFYKYLGKETVDWLYTINEFNCWAIGASMEASTEKGWTVPGFDKVVRIGYSGLIAQIDEELAKTRVLDDDTYKKDQLLRALKSVLQAAIVFSHRYADLARKMAESSRGQRKDDLERIAYVCERVPEFPAESFHEAVQSMWFSFLLTYWDTRAAALGLGRVDQYLYPHYKNDIDKGIIDREYATQILECLRVKLSSRREFHNATIRQNTNGGTIFHNCTIGGITRDGRDAANELSFVWLDAAERTRTPHPTLSVRWHEKLDPAFAMRAMEICRLGMGFPAFFGDKSNIEYLMGHGVPLEEARDYALGGCVLPVVPGKTANTWPAVTNMAKMLEITLNNGKDPRTGVQVGPKTGDYSSFHSMEDIFEAYKIQIRTILKYSTNYLNKVRIFRQEALPDLIINSFIEDCITKGKVAMGDGAHYQHSCMYMLPVGVVDVADSLAAIKKCVFDENAFTMQELMEALSLNFEGKEHIRKKLMSTPRYGNDDDTVDHIAGDIYRFLVDTCRNLKGAYGTRYVCAPHNLAFHGAMGMKTGALPSGRLAGLSLADGAVSASQGNDVNGPSAVLNSSGKIDHTPLFGTLLNMKFTPSALKTPQDCMKLLALLRTYFTDYGGKHIQFNVVDRETLMDAKAHPENYRNLVVRVAGYSALWVELNETMQDELIARTEHCL